jgi:hypothetical protein
VGEDRSDQGGGLTQDSWLAAQKVFNGVAPRGPEAMSSNLVINSSRTSTVTGAGPILRRSAEDRTSGLPSQPEGIRCDSTDSKSLIVCQALVFEDDEVILGEVSNQVTAEIG